MAVQYGCSACATGRSTRLKLRSLLSSRLTCPNCMEEYAVSETASWLSTAIWCTSLPLIVLFAWAGSSWLLGLSGFAIATVAWVALNLVLPMENLRQKADDRLNMAVDARRERKQNLQSIKNEQH